jgi:hypothetical protein
LTFSSTVFEIIGCSSIIGTKFSAETIMDFLGAEVISSDEDLPLEDEY